MKIVFIFLQFQHKKFKAEEAELSPHILHCKPDLNVIISGIGIVLEIILNLNILKNPVNEAK